MKKAKKKVNKKQTEKEPIKPLADTGDERLVKELVDLFAGAIQALNNGVLPMPTHWRGHLEEVLKFHQVGSHPDPEVERRRNEMATEMLEERIKLERTGKRPNLKGVTLDLATKYSSSNVHRDIKGREGVAAANIITRRLNEKDEKKDRERAARVEVIKKRQEAGENLDDILYNPATSSEDLGVIWNHQEHGTPLEGVSSKPRLTEYEKASAWISDGMNRHILAPDSYQTFVDPDPEVIAALKSKEKRRVKK